MSELGFQAAALLHGLLHANTEAERQALFVAASRVNAGKSSTDCIDEVGEHRPALDRDEQCLLCGKVGK